MRQKNQENNIPGTLISNRGKYQRTTYTQTNTFKKIRKGRKERPKEQKYRLCDAPNWNLNDKCPARG